MKKIVLFINLFLVACHSSNEYEDLSKKVSLFESQIAEARKVIVWLRALLRPSRGTMPIWPIDRTLKQSWDSWPVGSMITIQITHTVLWGICHLSCFGKNNVQVRYTDGSEI